ncbi:hypothetical protein RND81_04G145600 [Saponaria officinalis]|uniref:ENTH domain-containing protein n=1 Tax=Saponaria officinalis TaxID=3572 RepID=A0AAW1LPQ1_SAPOF
MKEAFMVVLRLHVNELVCKRIERTRDWIVALKCLILIHRLVIDGGVVFVEEIACANASIVKGGGMLSNMYVFKDEAHPNSWDYTEFVRRYGMYLDEKVELIVFDNMCLRRRMRFGVSDGLNELGEKESRDEMSVLSRMEQLQRMLERVLAMRPRTVSKHQKWYKRISRSIEFSAAEQQWFFVILCFRSTEDDAL